MSFIDYTSAGAFVKAVQMASESDRRHAQRHGQTGGQDDVVKRRAAADFLQKTINRCTAAIARLRGSHA